MMLPAIIRGGVSAKLERAQAEQGKAEAAIIELQSRLSSLDLEQDDYATTAQALNAQINVQEKALSVLALQVEGLANKVEIEERAAAKARREAAIKKAQGELLPQYLAAVEAHAAALLGPRTTRAKLVEARKAIAQNWPIDDLELPFSFYLDVARADRALQATIGADDATAKEIAADFVAHECRMISDLIKSWAPAENEEQAA